MQINEHAFAEIVPMTGRVTALVRDIRKHGQREPIITFEDRTLDGRGRHLACLRLGLEPKVAPYVGDDALLYVLKQNRERFNKNQLALIIARAVLRFGRDLRPLLIALGVSETMGHRAMRLVIRGTETQVLDVLEGRVALSVVADNLPPSPRGKPGPKPKSKPTEIAMRGREVQREAATLWNHLREAFENLGSLPRPHDTARYVRKLAHVAKIIDQRLPGALQWMEDFANEWKSRDDHQQNGGATDPVGGATGGSGDDTNAAGRGRADDTGSSARAPQA